MRYLLDLFSTWINRWIRKEVPKPKLDQDFALVELQDAFGDPITGVKILTGQYTGLVYNYTTIKVAEDPSAQSATLRFSYHIVETVEHPNICPPHETDENLHFVMGEILNVIVFTLGDEAETVSAKKTEMDDLDAQTRTHYIEEPDSQF